ncbi:hypothetical protein [Leifsonia soli]|uniref:Uncharacterized protein n=1 Tax=Leifsonia soli TaxID=582665 RepID=A0A852T2I4_9MICO|nr:hypothetical protein [Leifsonia soli]NYD74894.1 hypothetical protein [Leifsonia soli]
MSTVSSAPNPYAWVRHLLPRVVIGALIAAALVGVYAVILGRFDDTCWRLIGTIALFVFFALVSWYDADVSARRAPWFGAVSVVTSVYLFGIGLWKVWVPDVQPVDGLYGSDAYDPWWQPFSWFLLVLVTRIGLLHIHLVLNTQRRFTGPIMSKVTVATLVLVGLLTAGLSLPLIWTRVDFGETYWRLVAVVAILDALGTVLIPLTYSLFGPKAVRPAPSAYAAPAPSAGPGAMPYAQPPMQAPTQGPAVAPPAAPAGAPGWTPAPPPTPAGAPGTAAAPASAYPRLDASGGLRLEWPRYINGQPLPARPDGTPDFTGVVGY